jgi:putative oxidoreductase
MKTTISPTTAPFDAEPDALAPSAASPAAPIREPRGSRAHHDLAASVRRGAETVRGASRGRARVLWPRLIATSDDRVATLLRVTLGLVMFPHAAQKVFGWFGGFGLEGTMGYLTGSLGIPVLFGGLAIAAELLGSLGLLAGLLTRVAAFGIASVMAVAALTVHLSNGFFMNWTGAQAGEGYEYHILAAAIAVAVMVKGGGALSIDRALQRWS